jgi:hypothetical protein
MIHLIRPQFLNLKFLEIGMEFLRTNFMKSLLDLLPKLALKIFTLISRNWKFKKWPNLVKHRISQFRFRNFVQPESL